MAVVAAAPRSRRALLITAAGAALALFALLASASAVFACTPEQVRPLPLAEIEGRVALVVDGTVTETAYDDETGTGRLEIRIIRVLRGSAAGVTAVFHDQGNCPFMREVGTRVLVAAVADGALLNGWSELEDGSVVSHYRTVPEVTTWSAVRALFGTPDTAMAEPSPKRSDGSVSEIVLLLAVGLTSFAFALQLGTARRHGRRPGAIPRT